MRKILAAALIATTISGCATRSAQFVIVLPNGYQIDRDRSSNTRIVKRGGSVAVQGPIAGYTVIRDIVTGYIGEPPPAGSTAPTPPPDPKATKYFVLDTSSGKVSSGLDAAAWNTRLKELGAPPSPDVAAPILPQ